MIDAGKMQYASFTLSSCPCPFSSFCQLLYMVLKSLGVMLVPVLNCLLKLEMLLKPDSEQIWEIGILFSISNFLA